MVTADVIPYPRNNMPTLEADIADITACWQRTTSDYLAGVFATGVKLIAIYDRRHGESFTALADRLPFRRETGVKLMQIARKLGSSHENYRTKLPAAFESLYLLSTLPEDVLKQGFEDGTINANMERKDVLAMKPKNQGKAWATKSSKLGKTDKVYGKLLNLISEANTAQTPITIADACTQLNLKYQTGSARIAELKATGWLSEPGGRKSPGLVVQMPPKMPGLKIDPEIEKPSKAKAKPKSSAKLDAIGESLDSPSKLTKAVKTWKEGKSRAEIAVVVLQVISAAFGSWGTAIPYLRDQFIKQKKESGDYIGSIKL